MTHWDVRILAKIILRKEGEDLPTTLDFDLNDEQLLWTPDRVVELCHDLIEVEIRENHCKGAVFPTDWRYQSDPNGDVEVIFSLLTGD